MMRQLTLIICFGLVPSSLPFSAVGKDNPLFDRYGNISFEAEKTRLDNYAIQLKSSPISRGFIVVYSGGSWNSGYDVNERDGVRPPSYLPIVYDSTSAEPG